MWTLKANLENKVLFDVTNVAHPEVKFCTFRISVFKNDGCKVHNGDSWSCGLQCQQWRGNLPNSENNQEHVAHRISTNLVSDLGENH